MLFCSIYDIEDLLQIEVSESFAIRAMREVKAAIQNYTRQTLEVVENDSHCFDVGQRQTRLLLPQLPVNEIVSVVENGETLTDETDYKLGNHGILHRVGAYWFPGVQTVTVVNHHGYSELNFPDDIKAVATRAAARVYQAGLRSAEMEGVLGVNAKSLGDFSVQFGSEQGGGSGEGLLGASAARILLWSEKDILNKYRV